ncbi:hypothetical protein [Nitratireductor pacificus]|uniref:Lipoprotein n=1 Tax=Nitratireductor pacificus pht-3B TaxID=391937 RepID=K2MTM7_9HYPH|nr:hypothetical protein NA2_02969 [Nitratireductor pacificus pht-3B]
METKVRQQSAGMVAVSGTLLLAATVLSGCVGAPTYGTGKAADQQLLEDVTGVLALGPRNKERIEYKPRAGIVMPASTEVLPTPQDDVATSGNPAWPESPEQRLARIRAEATENQDNPLYRSPVQRDIGVNARGDDGVLDPAMAKRQREEVLKQRAELGNVNPTSRRYLSEPPVAYRQPADSAPVGELGETEAKKQREAKRAAQKNGGGFDLRRMWPWGS